MERSLNPTAVKFMEIINPSNEKVIARVTLGDEEDVRRAIAAAKRAFVSFAIRLRMIVSNDPAQATQGRLCAR